MVPELLRTFWPRLCGVFGEKRTKKGRSGKDRGRILTIKI
jgi:hypothetical protein